MPKYKLNEKKLSVALEVFKDYSSKPNFKEDILDRKERKEFIHKVVRGDLNELNFSEVIKKLWASQIWANKEYLVDKIIKENGFEKLRDNFMYLISGKDTPGQRYEKFLSNIKYMGPSMVTEIICYTDPKNAGIWNDKARKALSWLEVDAVRYDKYKITGEEYDNFNAFLKELSSILEKKDYRETDLLFIDYFLWEIWDKLAKNEPIKVKEKINEKSEGKSRHDEIRDKLAQIGSWLGFEIETEKLIAVGSKVDVIWRARIANLGAVSYAFEVQDRGSTDSLLINLQKAQIDPTIQRLIVVSDSEQIEKIKKYTETMPENFRKAAIFWEADDVDATYQNLEQVTDSISKLKLVEG